MARDITRRDLFKAAKVTGAAVLGGAVITSVNSFAGRDGVAGFPWTYKKVDPDTAALRAYNGCFEAGCMFGAFEGVIGTLAEEHGEPFSSFPRAMMSYGGEGIAGWGTVCGTLNGTAAAVSLFVTGDARKAIIDELFNWFIQTPLPVFVPKEPKHNFEIKPKRPGSPLCHISISNSDYLFSEKELSERCLRLAADVSARAAVLLNSWLEGEFTAATMLMQETNDCLSCHDDGRKAPKARTKMNCVDCHPQDLMK